MLMFYRLSLIFGISIFNAIAHNYILTEGVIAPGDGAE